MKNILFLTLFLYSTLFSFDFISFKHKETKDKIDKIWIKETQWFNEFSNNENRRALRIIKKDLNDMIYKDIYILDEEQKYDKLALYTMTYDVLLFDLSSNYKDKKILKQETILCSLFLNNLIDKTFFIDNLVKTNKLFFKEFSSVKNSIKLYKHKEDLNSLLLIMNKIANGAGYEKISAEDFKNLIN